MPNLFVIAGPNGAGKSTTAPKLLSGSRRVEEFINADTIAEAIAKDAGAGRDLRAGRSMLGRLEELVAARRDVAFESTISGLALLRRIETMQAAGYLFHLIYLWLPSPGMAVQRVAARVRDGGHAVPESVIRRRYRRSVSNFFNRYRPIADSWLMLDNSGPGEPQPIAWRNVGERIHIVKRGPWGRLRKRYEKDSPR